MTTGKLYLIPTPLGDEITSWLLPHDVQTVQNLRYFVAESAKTARKHLKLLDMPTPIRELNIQELNKHTDTQRLPELLQPALQGYDIGIVSEAGCPAVADPGSTLVALAHQKHIEVKPLVGPCSILLALMASGANGQSFAFKGYIPQDSQKRKGYLKDLESRANQYNETQLFIETPYRNMSVLEDALTSLNPNTKLCIAVNLTLPSQHIYCYPISIWQKLKPLPDLKKYPCIFLIF